MTVGAWLAAAVADAERRGLAPLKGLLEMLARSTTALRAADDALRKSSGDTIGGLTAAQPGDPPP
jgi:hypothetical protein